MYQIKVVQEIKTHILFSVNCFSENRAICEIMLKNMVQPERPQMAKWRRVACWISKATRAQVHARAHAPTHTYTRAHTHTYTEICYIYCVFTTTMVS